MLKPDHSVVSGFGHLKFVAQPCKDNSEIQAFRTFVETVRGHHVQVRGRNQPHQLCITDKGKTQVAEDRLVKPNPEPAQMVLSRIPVGKLCLTALGGGDVSSWCINVDFNFREINLVGNNKKFPLRCSSNSNEFVYGKERDLMNSCWTRKGLTVEVNGGKKRGVHGITIIACLEV